MLICDERVWLDVRCAWGLRSDRRGGKGKDGESQLGLDGREERLSGAVSVLIKERLPNKGKIKTWKVLVEPTRQGRKNRHWKEKWGG